MSGQPARVVARHAGRRLWKGAAIGIGTSLVLVLVLAAGSVWVLGHLGHPRVKPRWIAAVREASGLDVDVDALSVSPGGRLSIAGLRIAQPVARRAFAPDLASLDALDARLDLPALLSGRVRVRAVEVRGVRVTVIQDESGRTSLDDVADGLPSPESATAAAPPAPSPRSRMLETGDLDLDLGAFTVRDVAACLLRTEGGAVAARQALEGLDLDLTARAARGQLDAAMSLASPEAGTTLSVREFPAGTTRPAGGTARGRLALKAEVRGSRKAGIVVEANLLDQDLDARLPRQAALLSGQAEVTLDPPAGEVRLDLSRLEAALGSLSVTARVTLPDAPRDGDRAVVDQARIAGRSEPIEPLVRALLPALGVHAARIDGDLAGLAIREGAPGLAIRGPAALVASLGGLGFEGPGAAFAAEGIEARIQARLGPDGAVACDLEAAARTVSARAGARVQVSGMRIRGGIGELPLAGAVSGNLSGTARLEAQADLLEAEGDDWRTRLADAAATLSGRMDPDGNWSARLDLPVRRVAAVLPGGRALPETGPASLSASAEGPGLPSGDPATWRGEARAIADLPGLHADLAVRRPGEAVEWTAGLDGVVPGALGGLLPAAPRSVLIGPGPRVSLRAEGRASITPFAVLEGLDGKVRGEVTGLSLGPGSRRLDVASARLEAEFAAPRMEVEATASIEATGARLDGRPLANRARLSASTRPAPDGRQAALDLSADAGPGEGSRLLEARLQAAWRPAARRLEFTLDGNSSRFESLRVALAPDDPARPNAFSLDGIRLEGKGRLEGLGAGAGGLPALPGDPVRALRGAADVSLALEGLHVRTAGVHAALPGTRLAARLDAGGDSIEVVATFAGPSVDLGAGSRTLQATDVAAEARVRLPRDADLRKASLSMSASIGSAAQDLYTPYPVRNLSVSAQAEVSPDAVRLERFVLDHPAGGTRLEFSADATLGRQVAMASRQAVPGALRARSLRVEGTLNQDLASLSGDPAAFRGTGHVRVPFRVESGDGTRLDLLASLESPGASFQLPAAGFSLEGARGRMAVTEELELGPDGRLSIVQGPRGSPWSRVRFHDVNPYLHGGWFAADRVAAGSLQAGPLAGNLRLDRTVLSLDQLQAAWRGGKVTGLLVLDRGADDTRVWFKGDATGIQAGSKGEGLDANAALHLSLRNLEVDGRVQFLRIGRGHLRRLLDLWDPAMENVSANRIRKVLGIGYPKAARVRLDGGFLSARVELGGIASVVRIDEVRGIPVGPLLRRTLGDVLPAQGGTP